MLVHPTVWSWLHLEWLWFLASPIPNYLSNITVWEGAVLPGAVTTALLLKYWRHVKDKKIITGFTLFAVTIGIHTQYWGATGLHIFTGSIIIWPTLALLLGNRFPWLLAYALAFIGTVLPDLYGAGTAAQWSSGWFYGVGGAGFQDGDFVTPLLASMAAAITHVIGNAARDRGYFLVEPHNNVMESPDSVTEKV
jgi:hypothetical protein